MKQILYNKFRGLNDSDESILLLKKLGGISKEINSILVFLGCDKIYSVNENMLISDKVNDCFNRYSKNIDDEKMLYLVKLRKLFNDYCVVRNEIFILNQWLVYAIVNDYCGDYDFSMEDIIQYGNIYLLRLIERYNIEEGKNFCIYACISIYGYLLRNIINSTNVIALPQHIIEDYNTIIKKKKYLSNELGRNVTNRELADKIQLSYKKIDSVLSNFDNVIVFSDEEMVADNKGYLSLDGKIDELLSFLKQILTDRQYFVLVKNFGLEDRKYTELELASIMGISRQSVSGLKRQALVRIKRQKNRLVEEFKD